MVCKPVLNPIASNSQNKSAETKESLSMRDLRKDFHMIGGTGESSYAANSTFQRKIASRAMCMVKEAVQLLVSTIPSSEMLLVFADLGCSTGTNTLLMFSEVMNQISVTCNKLGRHVPEIQLLLNDLPGNDFNTLLGPVLSSYKEIITESRLDKYISFYPTAVPGSFYERLFPKMSLHFLSQVPGELTNETEGPINRTSFWISKKSPPLVSKLYLEQFQNDFFSFLRNRSEELCSEGCMALIFNGRTNADPTVEDNAMWISCYEEAFCEFVSLGIVKASDVESFNIPLYLPSMAEVKSIIQMEGSFEVIQNDIFQMNCCARENFGSKDAKENLKKVAHLFRAVMEPLVLSHFGDSIRDPLSFSIHKFYEKHFWKEEGKWEIISISLKKK